MGLIRKQTGFDLKVKIEKWVSESLGSIFQYTIDDDYRINVSSDGYCWYTIAELLKRDIEIPDYISFAFKKKIDGTLWNANIEKLVDLLNKHPHSFHNLERLILINYTPWGGIGGEKIKILKIDGKFVKI